MLTCLTHLGTRLRVPRLLCGATYTATKTKTRNRSDLPFYHRALPKMHPSILQLRFLRHLRLDRVQWPTSRQPAPVAEQVPPAAAGMCYDSHHFFSPLSTPPWQVKNFAQTEGNGHCIFAILTDDRLYIKTKNCLKTETWPPLLGRGARTQGNGKDTVLQLRNSICPTPQRNVEIDVYLPGILYARRRESGG